IARVRSAEQREALEADLVGVEAAIRRLTAAIVEGGELTSLVSSLDTFERRRTELHTRLDAIRAHPAFDIDAIRRKLGDYLKDWQGLLRGHVHQGQQVLRRLIKDRLTFTPTDDGYYMFTGTGSVQPVLSGVVRMLASPAGFEPAFWP